MTFLKPEQIIREISLKPDMVAAEFGCGSGGFVIPLAKKLEDGLVYAIDVQEAPLNVLKSKFIAEKLSNVKIIKADLEKNSSLRDGSVDLVIISNTLFQAEDRKAMISEANRVLKPGGNMIIIDWLESAPLGPERKVSSEEVKKMAEGFQFLKNIEAGQYHYGLVFAKK
jgi:ubiquinone/menaquinone biosynthesis C-methylase UbiE